MLAVAAPAVAQQQPAADTAVRPLAAAPDQARGIDAEVRTALFELASDRPLAAIDRLEWLRSVVDSSGGTTPAGGRIAGELRFLLAEGYYRAGLAAEFRAVAVPLAASSDGARYASVLNAQLLVDAYRRGDDAAARALAARGTGGDRGLASLLVGLAAYRAGDWTGARTAFAAARAAGGVYAPFAQYMDALAVMGGDTTRAGAALDALTPLTSVATGDFGDQVRLTAAELAYQSGHYDAAASFAQGVSPTSGLAAQALRTRAWALYRARKLDDARAAFAELATRYPNLPERDEARLMVGQSLLEAGHAADAEAYFAATADSMGADVATLQAKASTALAAAARALVQARVAELAFLADPRSGRTLALPDEAAAGAETILAAFDGEAAPPEHTPPEIVSLADIAKRTDSLVATLGADFPPRLLYAPVSSAAVAAAFADRSQGLAGADAAVVLARFRLQEQLDAQATRIIALEDLQHLIVSGRADLAANATVIAAVQDSLGQMNAALEAARQRVRAMLQAQVDATRRMAAENAQIVDSARTALGGQADSTQRAVLDIEAQTAMTYAGLADSVAQQLDAVIARRPPFVLRDSLTVRLARAHALHDQTATVFAADDSVVTGALAALRARESDRARAMRAALVTAESRRTAAEAQLVSLVDGELRARATALIAALQRQREAADYGSASAAFFHAIGQDGAAVKSAASSSPGTQTPPR